MSWQLGLFLLILGLPLIGATVAIVLRRVLSERAIILIGALSVFLVAVAVILLVELLPPGEENLGQWLSAPQGLAGAPASAPTARWEQAPRTLAVTETLVLRTPTPTPPATTTPTTNPVSLVTIAVRNGEGSPGLATRVANRLEQEGFSIVEIENDRLVGDRPHTLILDKGDHPAARQIIVELLDIGSDFVETYSTEPGDADIIVIVGDDYGD
jgi:hypothetical protein